MTDAHTHVVRGEERAFLCSPTDAAARPGDVVFYGRHPWEFLPEGAALAPQAEFAGDDWLAALRAKLEADPGAGVGEIGLDRLKVRTVPEAMRSAFAAQLELAAELHRPVVLHGAKCWGEVVKEVKGALSRTRSRGGAIPALLFHGFSRSGGLIPDIVALNGFISAGPALLNDHAVNYRELVKSIPEERLLVESDATPANASDLAPLADIVAKLAELRGRTPDEMASVLDANAARLRPC